MSDRHLIADLIRRPSGYVVELNNLCASRMDNGKFKVAYYVDDGGFSEEFVHPWDAAEFFLEKKKELGLGFSAGS